MHKENKKMIRSHFAKCDWKQENVLDGFLPYSGTNKFYEFLSLSLNWGRHPNDMWNAIRK